MRKHSILPGVLLLVSINSFGQQIILSEKVQNKQIKEVSRVISLYEDDTEAAEMNAGDGSGLGILTDIEFTKGIIEVELLGENNPGKSFIGIAFNIQNDNTYEAIYFRPFNFVADEQIRKEHMLQYIFEPEYTWNKLRKERTGEFEHEIVSPPNPDEWFMARIRITDEKVEVYVNEIFAPVLTIDRLTSTKSKKIALWVGHGSSGRFRNLILQKEK